MDCLYTFRQPYVANIIQCGSWKIDPLMLLNRVAKNNDIRRDNASVENEFIF